MKHDEKRSTRETRKRGRRVVWPRGLEEDFGISAITRWKWERDGKLPKRDVCIGSRTGWKPETIEAALNSRPAA